MPKTQLKGPTQQKVLILPALTQEVLGKRIHFLFSLSQVADIARDVQIQPVPFSPPFVEGIARWRNIVVPVLSLEVRLGLERKGPRQVRRHMVVQTASMDPASGTALLCMLNADRSVRSLSMPIECTAAKLNGWIPQKDLLRNVYEWEEGFLVVAHMEKVLSAEVERDASKTEIQKK